MNRRIPRVALLVVMLLSMLVVFQGAGNTTTGLAQDEPSSCDFYFAGESVTEQSIPAPGTTDESGSFQVDSVFQAPKDEDLPFGQTLIQFTLFADGEVSLLSPGNSIIRVDSSEVTVWNCGETTIAILNPDGSTAEAVEPGQHGVIGTDHAIIVGPKDIYYLTQGNADELEGTPVAGIQQLSNDLSVDALTIQPGSSKVSSSSVKPAKLCSKGSC